MNTDTPKGSVISACRVEAQSVGGPTGSPERFRGYPGLAARQIPTTLKVIASITPTLPSINSELQTMMAVTTSEPRNRAAVAGSPQSAGVEQNLSTACKLPDRSPLGAAPPFAARIPAGPQPYR